MAAGTASMAEAAMEKDSKIVDLMKDWVPHAVILDKTEPHTNRWLR